MPRMTRTQVTLEEDEYLFLKTQAAESGTSLSSVVRSLVRARMSQAPDGVPHIWDLAGIITDCDYEDEDHDTLIYRWIASKLGDEEGRPG
jgi:hypothetical protein